jgi:hypothetical protein
MRLLVAIAIFLSMSCKKSDGEWFIHFKDGDEFEIIRPFYVDNERRCASKEFDIAPYASMGKYYMKEKYVGIDGYTYRRGNALEHYRFCEEVK